MGDRTHRGEWMTELRIYGSRREPRRAPTLAELIDRCRRHYWPFRWSRATLMAATEMVLEAGESLPMELDRLENLLRAHHLGERASAEAGCGFDVDSGIFEMPPGSERFGPPRE